MGLRRQLRRDRNLFLSDSIAKQSERGHRVGIGVCLPGHSKDWGILMRIRVVALLFVLFWLVSGATAAPQSAAFTYQGRLELNGTPYSGSANLLFRLWDDPIAGGQVAAQVTRNGVLVDNGVFTVDLDFGAAFGTDQRWLEIIVNGQPLVPRQPITVAPMAMYALTGLAGPVGHAGPVGPAGPQGMQGVQGIPGLGHVAYGGTAHESQWYSLVAPAASYAAPLGVSGVRASESLSRSIAPSACTMRDLRVSFTSSDAAFLSTAVTLMRNGVATALTCSANLGGVGTTTCTDLSNTVALSAGDALSLRFIPAFPHSPLTNSEAEHRVFANFGLRCIPST